MSAAQKESQPTAAEHTAGVDIEMEISGVEISKSGSIGTSDGQNTSNTSIDKKPAKKKKCKKSSNQPHKKMKKDPNKPEYPRVGMYRWFFFEFFFFLTFFIKKYIHFYHNQ